MKCFESCTLSRGDQRRLKCQDTGNYRALSLGSSQKKTKKWLSSWGVRSNPLEIDLVKVVKA